MTVTIDQAGRLVVPKALREAAGIQPGMPLEVRVHDGRIEIEPAPVRVRIEDRGGFPVAVHEGPVPVLAADVVTETRDRLRHDRG